MRRVRGDQMPLDLSVFEHHNNLLRNFENPSQRVKRNKKLRVLKLVAIDLTETWNRSQLLFSVFAVFNEAVSHHLKP
ncbi:Hypothetical predicted protein [Octopus vulgaris]|uniref:Uncharacterized protein n=1 Tax=Octopus vulgaris TaxID=6645 RepID=A0AA36AXC5_OCTVU|nr:Hypothetical predicted protein [Octopus vulgaris]